MSRAIVAIFALLILGVGGVYGLEAALETAGEDVTVDNETWQPNAGSVTQLDNSNRDGVYYNNETRAFNATGVEVEEGTDYVWFENNGTVKAVQGGELDGEAEASITYSFSATSEEQRGLANLVGQVPMALGLLFPVMVFVVFLLIVRG